MRLTPTAFCMGLVLFSYSVRLHAQQEETLYYDENWEGTKDVSKAQYYRVVSFKDGLPIGPMRDYYITGELHAEIAHPIEVGRDDDSETRWRGEAIVYYKSGQRRGLFNTNQDGLEHGPAITWYENGNKEQETYYQNGLKHGPTTLWLSNGTKLSVGYYQLGELVRVVLYNPDGTVKDSEQIDEIRRRSMPGRNTPQ